MCDKAIKKKNKMDTMTPSELVMYSYYKKMKRTALSFHNDFDSGQIMDDPALEAMKSVITQSASVALRSIWNSIQQRGIDLKMKSATLDRNKQQRAYINISSSYTYQTPSKKYYP